MRRLLALSIFGSFLLIGSNPAIADWDTWAIKTTEKKTLREMINMDPDPPMPAIETNIIEIYQYDSFTGEETLINRFEQGDISHIDTAENWRFQPVSTDETAIFKPSEGVFEFKSSTQPDKKFIYDINNNSWSTGTYSSPENAASSYQIQFEKAVLVEKGDGSIQIGSDANDVDVVADGFNIDGAAVITKKGDGTIQIGTDANDIDITTEGLNIDGNPLITKKDNGEIHIGKNSLITTSEEKTLSDGTKVQPLYAKDADGNKIPINIDGSKLLIDGVEVTAGGNNAQITTNKNDISTNKANIKNLGEGVAGSTALTAALTALPQTSKESKLSCGVGTGAYSSRYAVGFGCASKVNERVDINAGGSYVFGGSKSYGGGTLDSGVVKAGFVFKLGELKKPTQISMKEKKELKQEISILKENNQNILAQNQALLARLESLEKITLGASKSQDLAVYKLK